MVFFKFEDFAAVEFRVMDNDFFAPCFFDNFGFVE